jgi:hypothetical protein
VEDISEEACDADGIYVVLQNRFSDVLAIITLIKLGGNYKRHVH